MKMNWKRWNAMCVLGMVLAAALGTWGQANPPLAAYVYPAGGQQGTTFEVTVGGQFLNGAHDVFVSGNGITAEVVGVYKPLSPIEMNDMREQLKQLQEKRKAGAWSVADAETTASIRQKMATTRKRRDNPAFADIVTLRVTIAVDAAVGSHELRLSANSGLTNPLVFYVDQLPEYAKAAAWQAPLAPEELVLKNRGGQRTSAVQAEPPIDVTLPVTVNGEIMPGGADGFRFRARKGQHLVIAARTRSLIPYISDAVPGWFQAALTLYDAKGSEIAYADHYRFQQEPVILYEVPADGEFTVQIRDTLYRGREDFVYRIEMGELPFVTSVFPLGGRADGATRFELTGWNLQRKKITQSLQQLGLQTFSVREGSWNLMALPADADTLPEIMAGKSNHAAAQAQALKLPVMVNGRIERPGQWSVFRFNARAGERIVAEVLARRLNSPLDSVLRLTDANGKEVGFNDDFDDPGAALLTHQADSYLSLTLPKSGTYYLYLGDSQHNGGPEYAYRLRLSSPRPDFELRAVPSSISLRPGLVMPVSIYVLRHDGFSGEVSVHLKDAPRGWVLSGGRIPAGQNSVRMTLAAPSDQTQPAQGLTLDGVARIDGQEVHHLAVPAEDRMQAFAWHHLVPAQVALAMVSGRGQGRNSPWRYADEGPVKLPAGGSAVVQLLLPSGPFGKQAAQRLHLDLDAAPEGIAIENVSRTDQKIVFRLRADAGKVKPGLKGNLIVDVSMDPPPPSADAKQQANNRRVPLGVLPAIPFEVMAR